MTGNSSQRRKALRAAQRNGTAPKALRAAKVIPQPVKPMEWPEPLPHGFRRPTDEEIATLMPATSTEINERHKDEDSVRSKEIVEPEPRGEAEGAYESAWKCGWCHKPMTKVRPGKYQCDNPECELNEHPPFLRNLEKRSWLWNFFKRMWRAGK